MNNKTQDLDNLLGEVANEINNFKKNDIDQIFYIRSIPMEAHGRLNQFHGRLPNLFMMKDIKAYTLVKEGVNPGDYSMDAFMDVYRCSSLQESIIQSISAGYSYITGSTSTTAYTRTDIIPLWEKIVHPEHSLVNQFKELISLLAKADRAHTGRLNSTTGMPEEAKRADKPNEDKIKDFDNIEILD